VIKVEVSKIILKVFTEKMTKEETNKEVKDTGDKKEDEKKTDVSKDDKGVPLSAQDIKLIMRYGKGAYNDSLKKAETEISSLNQKITNMQGIQDTDTGLSMPSQWNPQADQQLGKDVL
jgi:NACalpha-BTF3-like transcription factor